ncbi:MAG TPA: GNAT family N-acetyltransferase [Fimbriimonas sp.]
MNGVTLIQVEHGSPAYDACLQLRREVLRRPLGLDFTPGQIAEEEEDVHLGAFAGEFCVGCLVLTEVDPNTVQMRQVAVRPDWQGRGVGKAMIRWSEQKALAMGFQTMILHARESAVDFYLRLGYEGEGDPFVEVTIPHRAMSKRLQASS